MVTAPSPPPGVERYKLCPTCGYATPASRNRCHHCWNDVATAGLLDAADAEQRLAREEALQADIASTLKRRREQSRYIRRVGYAMLVLLLGWWGYRAFIYTPPPVPTPSSTERSVVAGTDVWPITGGDLGGSQRTAATAALEGTERWASSLGAAPATAMVADAERLYLTLVDGRIVAVGIEDGAERWTYRLQNFPLAAPTVAGDRLYVPLRQGVLLALESETGEAVFESLATQSSFGTSPLVADGMAYVFGTGSLYGFDAENGELLWTVDIPSNWAFVTPVLTGQYVAVATGDRTLAFDRFTGQETYFYEFERAHPYSISVADDTIYSVSTRFGAAIEVDSRRPWWEGSRAVWNQFWLWGMAPSVPPPPALWVTSRPPRDGYPVAVGDDRLLLAGPEGDVRALDRVSGEELWRVAVDPIVAAPLVTPEGLLLMHASRLALYDVGSGEFVRDRAFEGSSLFDVVVTSHGTFVADAAGELIALR